MWPIWQRHTGGCTQERPRRLLVTGQHTDLLFCGLARRSEDLVAVGGFSDGGGGDDDDAIGSGAAGQGSEMVGGVGRARQCPPGDLSVFGNHSTEVEHFPLPQDRRDRAAVIDVCDQQTE